MGMSADRGKEEVWNCVIVCQPFGEEVTGFNRITSLTKRLKKTTVASAEGAASLKSLPFEVAA